MHRGEIGKRLKKLRELRGISQTALAKKCNISRRVIYNYERGCALSVDLADDVLKHLGGIHVLGVDLTQEESREVVKIIANMRKERLRKEREKQNAVFQRYREEESQRGNC